MLLRKKLKDNHLAWIGFGQMCLVLGLGSQAVFHPTADFWAGFLNGLSGAFVGVSIVFNVRGAYLVGKKHREGAL
jgi:hypothetical protein